MKISSTLGESKKEVMCGICEEKYTAMRACMKIPISPKNSLDSIILKGVSDLFFLVG